MPIAFEYESPARESFTKKEAAPEQTADRHHRVALFLSITALLISMGSFRVSWMSYQGSASNQQIADQAHSVGASLRPEIRVERGVTDLGWFSDSKGPIRFLFSLTLKNMGTAKATHIHLTWIESLTADSNSPMRASDEHHLPVADLDKDQEANLPLVTEMTSEEFRQFVHHGRAKLQISGQVNYKDASDKNHTASWTAILNGESILTVRN